MKMSIRDEEEDKVRTFDWIPIVVHILLIPAVYSCAQGVEMMTRLQALGIAGVFDCAGCNDFGFS
jgi:hypothetical protein